MPVASTDHLVLLVYYHFRVHGRRYSFDTSTIDHVVFVNVTIDGDTESPTPDHPWCVTAGCDNRRLMTLR